MLAQSWPLLSAFLVASLILAITPGPGVFYIVTRSVTQGRAAGLASVAGVALGNLGNALGASLGLAALFAVSAFAFTVVKYAGAAYLIYLGVQALRAPPTTHATAELPRTSVRRILVDGFVVALFNPKTAIFFAAFLPQFIVANGSPMLQSVTLGATFVAIAAVTDTLYVLAASTIAPRLARAGSLRTAGRYLTGAAFIGLGVLTAVGDNRARR